MLHHITLRAWRRARLYTFSTTSADCSLLSQYLHTSAVVLIHCISNKDIQCRPERGKGGRGGSRYTSPGPGARPCCMCFCISRYYHYLSIVQCVPLASKPGISLIILTPMNILQRNLNRSRFVVWEMKRNVSVVCVCSAPNCSLVIKLLKKCWVR